MDNGPLLMGVILLKLSVRKGFSKFRDVEMCLSLVFWKIIEKIFCSMVEIRNFYSYQLELFENLNWKA